MTKPETRPVRTVCVTKQEQKAAIKAMNPALAERFVPIKKTYMETQTGDLLRRHAIGCEVNAIMENEQTYGSGARELIAKGLGISPGELGYYQEIAKAWTRSAIDAMVQSALAKDHGFGYTHLSILSGIKSKADRKEMTKRCLAEMMSVRELNHAVQGLRTPANIGVGRPAKPPKTPVAGLLQMDKLCNTIANFEPLATEFVLDKLDGLSDAEWDVKLVKELEKTQKAVAGSRDAALRMEQRVRAAISAGKNALLSRKTSRAHKAEESASHQPLVDRPTPTAGEFAPVSATPGKKKKKKKKPADAVRRAKELAAGAA